MSFTLPDLPFAKDALGQYMSSETFDYHHGKHHKAYVVKLNGFVADKGLDGALTDIIRQATIHKWPFAIEHLDPRHIVRRTILKRCIYGVDKNPMAVELAKVALWLHTFTVGAPLLTQ